MLKKIKKVLVSLDTIHRCYSIKNLVQLFSKTKKPSSVILQFTNVIAYHEKRTSISLSVSFTNTSTLQ